MSRTFVYLLIECNSGKEGSVMGVFKSVDAAKKWITRDGFWLLKEDTIVHGWWPTGKNAYIYFPEYLIVPKQVFK